MYKKENAKYLMPPIVQRGKILKKDKQEQKSLKGFTITIIIFMVIILLFCGYSLSKTISEVILKSKVQIAEPIFVIESNPSVDITASNNTGTYSFKIKNYDKANNLTDINLKYYIEILSNTDNSVKFKILEDDKEIELNNKKTNFLNISKDKREERNYKVEITYDKDKNISASDIIQEIQIKVHTEQVKG